jgi:hypothetical protein
MTRAHGHGAVQHEHAEHEHAEHPPTGPRRSAVLDIGGDVGALILYTPPDLAGAEIDVSPLDQPELRTHTQVLERRVNGATIYAALYAALPAGTYRFWDDGPGRQRVVTVHGGSVAVVDWRWTVGDANRTEAAAAE